MTLAAGAAGSGGDAADVRYVRVVELVWRLASDRVLVRRTGKVSGESEAADLLGAAALVWIAVEEPSTLAEVMELTELDEAATREALDLLLAADWITRDPVR